MTFLQNEPFRIGPEINRLSLRLQNDEAAVDQGDGHRDTAR
jgi:hypothetical protein